VRGVFERTQTGGSLTVIAALSVAVLLIATVYQLTKTEDDANLGRVVVTTPTFTIPIPEQDSDNDGLPDWQEILIGTDPNNPDSDSDGQVDSYASIDYVQSGVAPNLDISPETLTPADQLGNRLISEYLTLKGAGAYTDERGISIGEKLAENINQVTPFEPYVIDEIQIDSDTSYERVLAYRKEMQEVFSPLLELESAEFVIYGTFIESRDASALEELLEIADTYDSAVKDALTITVPEDAADEHIDIVNALAFYAAVLRDMVRYSYDSVASFALLRTYTQAEEYVFTTFNTLSSYYVLKYRDEYGL